MIEKCRFFDDLEDRQKRQNAARQSREDLEMQGFRMAIKAQHQVPDVDYSHPVTSAVSSSSHSTKSIGVTMPPTAPSIQQIVPKVIAGWSL